MKIEKNQSFFKKVGNQINIFEKNKTQLYEKSPVFYFDFSVIYQLSFIRAKRWRYCFL